MNHGGYLMFIAMVLAKPVTQADYLVTSISLPAIIDTKINTM